MEILILGAGYAGLRAALDLAEAQKQGEVPGTRITLLDRNDYHQVITWLHDVAAAAVEPEEARIALDRLLDDGDVVRRQGEVRAISLREQRVILNGGESLPFDRLVVALGSLTAWPPVPGLREHALPMRWWDEAVTIRERIMEAFTRAVASDDESERRRLLTVVVAGGGYTGCQLAGELAHWLPDLADRFSLSPFDLTLRQIEAKPRLLPGWREDLSERAERVLRRKGVQILLDSPLEEMDATTMTLKGRTPLPYGTLIWAGGVRAPALLEESGLETGPAGRVLVDEFLRARAHPSLYVVGDSGAWMDGDEPLPATASHALRQGAYVARMIRREIQGRTLSPYEPSRLGLVVSLGGSDGVGTALGVPLSGVAAGILKEGIEAWYLSTIGAD